MKSKKGKLLIVTMCSLLFLTTGCGNETKLKDGKEVVGEIDGYTITAEDLYAELKAQGGSQVFMNMIDNYIADKEIEDDEEAEEYANSQIEAYQTQYEQQGQDFNEVLTSSGYKNIGEFKEELMHSYKKDQVVENYLKDELTDEEIEDYYDENIFGDMTVRHILIKPDTDSDASDEDQEAAEEEAKKQAEEIIQKLDDGADFEELAKEYSEDEGTKEDGGLLENFSKDSVVTEFWDAAYNLKDGEYTKEPVKSDYGYHVILRVSQKEKPELDEVRDTIEETLVNNQLNEDTTLSTKTWVKIREKYNLNISDSEIQDGYDRLTEE